MNDIEPLPKNATKDLGQKENADRAPFLTENRALESGDSRATGAGHGQTGRKHRFMSMILGKIGIPAADDSSDDGDGACSDDTPGGDRSSLCETIASPSADRGNVNRPMSFTYAPGSKPLAQYTIRRGVGIGGFGEVYFAVSEAGKEVALKRIQRNLEVELRGVSHCLNLKHANLVALFDICRDSADQAWVVMEYVNGPNLRQVLDLSPDGLPEPEVRRWFGAMAAGVNHLHSAGLVHRDLKPGNVFDDMGVVKVGDYGLSKFISATHRGGHTESVGTFHYMAPEIGRGEYGREIDIYAMGVVLYEMLTGQVPFDGESCHEIIVKHLTAEPDLSGVAEPYRGVIGSALHKDPRKRPSTVADMLAPLGMAVPTASSTVTDIPKGEIPVTATVIKDQTPVATVVCEPVAWSEPKGDAAGAGTATPVAAMSAPAKSDEPLARAVRESVSDLNRWWSSLDRSPGAKKLLLLIGAIALFLNTHWLLPLLSLLGIVYVPYYIVRQMILHTNQQPTYAEAQRIATVVGAPAQPVSQNEWRSQVRTSLRAKRSIHRAAELSTSWVAATFTVLTLAMVASVIGLRTGEINAFTIAPFAWMGMIILLGSMAIIGMGKLWERDEGESLPRRLVLAGIGAGVGVTSFVLNETLLLQLSDDLGFYANAGELPQALYHSTGAPRASAMMAHFALLFAAVRWWKAVDPLRRTRLSLWNVAVTVVAAWLVNQILPIPQPYGMMIAGGMAIAVQMSAPWIDPRTRKTRLHNHPYIKETPRSPGEYTA